MLMWIASVLVSLFHANTPAGLKVEQLDKLVPAHAGPADQNILKSILNILGIDGTTWP